MVDEFFAYMIDKSDKSVGGMLALFGVLITSLVFIFCVVVIAVGYAPWLIPLGMILLVVHQVKGFLNHRKKWKEKLEKNMMSK